MPAPQHGDVIYNKINDIKSYILLLTSPVLQSETVFSDALFCLVRGHLDAEVLGRAVPRSYARMGHLSTPLGDVLRMRNVSPSTRG